jgi:hypothetical protein
MIWRFKLIIFILFVLMHFNSIAQNVSSVTDFKVIHTINNNTTFHIPNQPLFFQSNKTTNTQFSILHSADEYFQLSATDTVCERKTICFWPRASV